MMWPPTLHLAPGVVSDVAFRYEDFLVEENELNVHVRDQANTRNDKTSRHGHSMRESPTH